MVQIRKAIPRDDERIWEILKNVISKGDAFAFSPDVGKKEMLAYWNAADKHTYVAIEGNQIAGTFFLKDNQPGLGSHIANAAYAVWPQSTGKGIGRTMGLFSLEEAKRLGYSAMQFNLVVKTNENALRLWKSLGFETIGEIPDAFDQRGLGFVNAYIMYKKL